MGRVFRVVSKVDGDKGEVLGVLDNILLYSLHPLCRVTPPEPFANRDFESKLECCGVERSDVVVSAIVGFGDWSADEG